MEQRSYIYALADPRTGDIRYIGKTSYELSHRLHGHILEVRRGGLSHKNNWIRYLLSLNLEPIISVLEIVLYPDSWQERECWWIASAKERGWRLTNTAVGGVGYTGCRDPERASQRMREAHLGVKLGPMSEEHKRKISEANKGRKFTDQHRQNMREAAKSRPPMSEEHKRKRSESLIGRIGGFTGKRHTEEVKRKLREASHSRQRSPRGTFLGRTLA